MAQGISPKLPLVYNLDDGPFELNKTTKETIAQNLKNLLLTAPGERVMDVNFGVGIRNFLFEGITPETYQRISTGIRQQVNRYMPFVELEKLSFLTNEDNPTINANTIVTVIVYTVPALEEQDVITISTKVD
jgi:uncharacterized protein